MSTLRKPHLTLVQKRTANSAVSAQDADEARFMEDLRGLVWARAGAEGKTWKALAAEARLAHQTVQKFASGETKRPNLFTVRRLVLALGCRLEISVPPRRKK